MDYKEAVALALAGEERGFGYLYANTQKSKFYLALQYVKDEAMAEDVLQEAYLKAFTSLEQLQEPDAFPGWLGRIVANTAKNMLAKKTPMYFADVEVDEEGQSRPVEDEKVENQPEIAYTQKETQELVHELIDSLSDEQRFCVLMFHIEGASISEIAAAMDCSENTVKSRLNYGRKNLKAKAEELQKKGYKLYNVAPLPLLLYLLRSEEQAMAADGTLLAGGNRVADRVFGQFSYAPDGTCRPEWNKNPGNTNGTGNQMGAKNMEEGIKQVGKTGLLHSTAAKIAVVTVVGILTVGTLYKMTHPETPEPLPIAQEEITQTASPASTTKAMATEEPKEKEVADNEYSTLIEGNLTKEELEYVLAYGPERIPKNGFKKEDHIYIVNDLCQGGEQIPGNYIKYLGIDSQYRHQYSLKDINRLYSSFTDYQFTEKNNNGANGGIEVKGKQIMFTPATLSYERTVHITAATYTPEEMDVYFDYEHMSYEEGTTTYKKKAILLPLPDGKYRIHSIQVKKDKSKTSSSSKSAEKADTSSVKDVYKGVLESLQKGEEDYKVKLDYSQDTSDGPYEYFVADLDGDGIKELVVGAEKYNNIYAFVYHDYRVFSCEKNGAGYQLKTIQGTSTMLNTCIPADGHGLYGMYFSPEKGMYGVERITINSEILIVTWLEDVELQQGTKQEKQFFDKNPRINWTSVSDLSGLDDL